MPSSVLDDLKKTETPKKEQTSPQAYKYLVASVMLALSLTLTGCKQTSHNLPEKIKLDKSLEELKKEFMDLKPLDISKITRDDLMRLSTQEQMKK